ncbi:MAG: hypothetical protein ACUVTZ_03710 [Armatimonadota bacterium]
MEKTQMMQYKVLSLGTDWHSSNPSEKAKDADKASPELRRLPDLQSLLNDLAAEGWQVIAVASCSTGISEVLVARPMTASTTVLEV